MYNYHNHTFRCHHAKGTDEEYVIKAIENGYTEIGFSDHAPYIFPNGHTSTFRMELDKTKDYVSSVMKLKEKYKDKIDIKLGFEVEYYPKLIEKELEYLKNFHYDFIILGQHFVDNEYEDYAKYSGSQTDSEETLCKYISQVIEAAKSGEFTYIAHPDLINFTGDKSIYKAKMEQMIITLNKIDIPIEFNFLGFTDKRNYPNKDFWEIAANTGNKVVIGLDAHNPSVYDDKINLKKANDYLKKLNIIPQKEINLISWNHK